MTVDPETESRLRREAMAWLTVRTNDGANSISTADLLDFTFDGEPFLLKDHQQGIRKPAGFRAALSMMTVYRTEGQERPYNDDVGADGLLRYKWRGTKADHYVNAGLRAAMHQGVPLIWFFGVGNAEWKPIYPIYVLSEEPDQQQFVVDPDVARRLSPAAVSSGEEDLRRYIIAETKRRLHQPVFRAKVMRAYQTRCAVCSLGHDVLLDAAHIVPDGQTGGEPVVGNGLALCKIHHAAYDARILGIRPDLTVEIRADLLLEIDGPMLKHGLQELHGQSLRVLPTERSERPTPARLAWSYEKFLAAPA